MHVNKEAKRQKGEVVMSRRDNFRAILEHRTPDDLILDLGGCPLSTMQGMSMYNLLDYLGIKRERPSGSILPWAQVVRMDEEMLEALDIDTRAVGATQVPARSQYKNLSENRYVDEFGIERVFTGLYWDIVNYPLDGAEEEALDSFDWPDPDSINMEALKREAARAKWLYEETDYVICADLPVYGVFELGCWMCGFEHFMIQMALNPGFVEKFSEMYWKYQKRVIELYYTELGKYIHYTASGDDFATQSNLFVSKTMFRDLIKPYLARRIAYTKQFTDAAFLHHSCGSVYDIIDDIIDAGVDILNPIQPGASKMEPERIKRDFGDQIVLHGGFDTQKVLPFGTRQQVEAEAARMINILNSDGGYIFACAHCIQEDVPPENVVTLFKAARKYGKRCG
jgi:uroporphyrinogen decarboxylase